MTPHLFCEHRGQGPDVVLLHGWGLHGGVWQALAEDLSAAFRVHVLDLPGHGRSRDMSLQPYALAALADAVAARVPRGAHWIGWSLGGQIALTAAQRHADAVGKLVLIGTTPRFARAPDWPDAITAATLDIFAAGLARDYRTTLLRFLSLQIGDAEHGRETLRHLRTELFRHGDPDADALHAGLNILKQSDLRDGLSAVTAPVLVLHGGRDTLAPPAAGRALAAGLAHARLEIIETAGHAPFLSHAAESQRAIENFLRD
jgi:pimeloyl-[acyl-carrier protein] methyl ester esterase